MGDLATSPVEGRLMDLRDGDAEFGGVAASTGAVCDRRRDLGDASSTED